MRHGRQAKSRSGLSNAIGEVPADGMGRLRQSASRLRGLERRDSKTDYNPFISHDFLSVARTVGLGPQPRRLAAHASRRRRHRRHGRRRRPLLRQIAFAGRIRLRPRLGRRLRARRRQLLSEAAGGGAVHAGDRPPPAGAAGRARRRRAQRAGRFTRRHLQALERLVGARHLPDRGRMAAARRARLSAAHPPAVPLGE